MIESIFHLFKIHRKMVFGNPSVIVQNMFRKTPESFNAVNMIFGPRVNQSFRVTHRMMLPQTFERVIAPERVCVVDSSFPRFLADDGHEFLFGHMLHHARIDLAIALQKAKYDVFARGAPTTLPFTSAAKVAFIHLHVAIQFAAFQFRHMVDGVSELLIDARNRFVVEVEIMGETVRRLLLIEPLNDGNFRSNTFQGFLFSTGLVPASHIPARCLRDLKRTAENALSSPQKVGRTVENVLFLHNQAVLYHVLGYETP